MNIRNSVLFIFSVLVLFSCKQRKELQKARAEDKPIQIPASFSLFDSVQTHRFNYRTLTAKINTQFSMDNGNELNVVVTMRAVKDSAIWMSVSPALGIEAARILFTADTIKIMDKLHASYAKEPYSFLKMFTHANITFDMLQNIFIGNAAFIDGTLVTDSLTKYYLAHCSRDSLLQQLVINKVFRIFGNLITDQSTNDDINISYGDFQFVESEYFPFDLKIEANSKGKTAKLVMNYSNVSLNSPVELRFNIPASYTKMN